MKPRGRGCHDDRAVARLRVKERKSHGIAKSIDFSRPKRLRDSPGKRRKALPKTAYGRWIKRMMEQAARRRRNAAMRDCGKRGAWRGGTLMRKAIRFREGFAARRI